MTSSSELSDHARRNREHWTSLAPAYAERSRQAWGREPGFEVLDLVELQAPEGAPDPHFLDISTEWARRWPAEEIWVARQT